MTPSRLTVAIGPVGELLAGSLADLSNVLEFEEFGDGAVVLRQGDDSDWLGVVVEGSAVVEQQIDADVTNVELLATISRGDIIGEMAFVDRRPRSATVRARGSLRLARLRRADFRNVMASDPDAAEVLVGTLLSTLASRLRDANDALGALYQAGRQIGTARNAEDVGAAVLQQISAAVPDASVGVVAMFSPSQPGCQPVVSFGLPATLKIPLGLHVTGRLVERLLAAPTGLVIAPQDPQLTELAFMGCKWCLATALRSNDRTLGVVALGSRDENNPFRPSHEVLMAVLANQAVATVARYAVSQ
jgi:CRP-like cAMP-binding protein